MFCFVLFCFLLEISGLDKQSPDKELQFSLQWMKANIGRKINPSAAWIYYDNLVSQEHHKISTVHNEALTLYKTFSEQQQRTYLEGAGNQALKTLIKSDLESQSNERGWDPRAAYYELNKSDNQGSVLFGEQKPVDASIRALKVRFFVLKKK